MLPLMHTRLRVGTGLACGPRMVVVQRGGFGHGKNGGALEGRRHLDRSDRASLLVPRSDRSWGVFKLAFTGKPEGV